ncbi:MAG: hypothetical protein OD811_01360 [Alphaproteobacteria bacterium]
MRNFLAFLVLLLIWVVLFPGVSWLLLSFIENVGANVGEATFGGVSIGFLAALVGFLLMLVMSGVATYIGLRVALRLVKGATAKAPLLIFLAILVILALLTDPILIAALIPSALGGWRAATGLRVPPSLGRHEA